MFIVNLTRYNYQHYCCNSSRSKSLWWSFLITMSSCDGHIPSRGLSPTQHLVPYWWCLHYQPHVISIRATIVADQSYYQCLSGQIPNPFRATTNSFTGYYQCHSGLLLIPIRTTTHARLGYWNSWSGNALPTASPAAVLGSSSSSCWFIRRIPQQLLRLLLL